MKNDEFYNLITLIVLILNLVNSGLNNNDKLDCVKTSKKYTINFCSQNADAREK